MMSVSSILFIVGFTVAVVGALFIPTLGIIGYVLHYDTGPEAQWWSLPLKPLGMRYSLYLAIATAVGAAISFKQLRWGKDFLVGQEKLMIAFLAIVWGVYLISEPTHAYSLVDHPTVKMAKVVVFVLMLTHIVTDSKNMNWFLWALVVGSLILGLEAHAAGGGAFAGGRLELVGGPDFTDSNTLAAYMTAMMPIIGVQFFRTGLLGKLVCLAAGVCTANAIILTRSRGAVVGLVVGAFVAILFAPRQHRGKIALGLVVVLIGIFFLADAGFWGRAGTISRSEEQMDSSARSRIELAKAGFAMALDHPLGVGPGNFPQYVGRYAPIHANRDAHNTYVRCVSEVGWIGLVVLVVLIVNAMRSLWRVIKRVEDLPPDDRQSVALCAYGLLVSLVMFAVCGIWGSLVYTESLWWLLALPVCMTRVVDNILEAVPEEGGLLPRTGAGRFKPRRSKRRKGESWMPVQ
jgi:putative inorganic carbon (hco3(-)) transporter